MIEGPRKIVVHIPDGFMAFETWRVASIVLRMNRVSVQIEGQADVMFIDFADEETARREAVVLAEACGFVVETPP